MAPLNSSIPCSTIHPDTININRPILHSSTIAKISNGLESSGLKKLKELANLTLRKHAYDTYHLRARDAILSQRKGTNQGESEVGYLATITSMEVT